MYALAHVWSMYVDLYLKTPETPDVLNQLLEAGEIYTWNTHFLFKD